MSTETSLMDLFEEIDVDDKFWKIDKKFNEKVKKILSLTSDNIYNYEEISSLNWKLDDIYNYILTSILYTDVDTKDLDDSKNIKSIAKYIINYDRERSKIHEIVAFEKKIGRQMKVLEKMRLIEVDYKERFGNTNKFTSRYRLSLNGLFYVIINWYVDPFLNVGSKFMLDPLLKNYSDSPLLKQFLLQYFERETLEDPTFDYESDILEYLEDICKSIIVNKKDKPRPYGELLEGMIPTTLFIWPSPESDRKQIYKRIENSRGLIEFLSRGLGNKKWLNGTQIIPDFENDQLQFKNSYFRQDAFIKINRRLRSVELVYKSKKYSTLKMYVKEDKAIAVIGKSTMSEKKLLEDHLNNNCKLKLFQLICSISMKNKGKAHVCKSLETDKKFKVITNELIDLVRIP